MRLFLAINPPNELRGELARATESVRAVAPGLAWVAEPLVHFTLKFLGEQPPEAIEHLEPVLVRLTARHREILMHVQGIGAFPNFRRARVVWLGVDAEARLELLHHDLEVACEGLGFEVEGRPFRPHMTLARVKHPLDEDAARSLARAAKQIDFRAEFVVRSVDLMRSELSPAGSRYTTLVSAPLRST